MSLSTFELLNPVGRNGTVNVDIPDFTNTVYNAVLYAFNQLMIGTITNSSGSAAPASNGGTGMMFALQESIMNPSTATEPAVTAVLESLFQNITISTIASPSLQANMTEAKQVQTRVWGNFNWYVYTSTGLYIAYSVAVCGSLGCVLVGMLALSKNGVSFTTDFSTVLATTRSVHVTVDSLPTGVDGEKDDEDLKKTKVMLHKGHGFKIVR